MRPAAPVVWVCTVVVTVIVALSSIESSRSFGAFPSPSLPATASAVDSRLASGVSALSTITPSARDTHEMAYDAESSRIVLFGGSDEHSYCGLSDTWAYDVANNSWQDMRPPVAPPGRCCPGMAYDSKADRVILFGGAAAGATYALSDTWAYDLNANTWTNMNPAVSPPARHGGPLVYDVGLDQVILFGGNRLGTSNLAFNDTWTYDSDSNTWTQVATATSPSLRTFLAMAYDIESDRVVLFGGETEPYSYASNETWAYDALNETWVKMTPATSPAPRFAVPAAYDARADRFLVFGGTGYPDSFGRNDTWAYDFNADTWSKVDTASKPSNRLTAMAYDAKSDRTVLFGGTWPFRIFGSPVYNRETWVFDHRNGTWTMVLGPLPPTASFTFSPTFPAVGDSVSFDGSASSDADGRIVWFVWDFKDGSPLSGTSVGAHDHAFSSAGTYAVTLNVTDDDGLTTSVTRQVVVGPAPDTVKPTFTIAWPAEGAILTSPTATVTGTASDDVGVAKVEVSLDNATWTVATGTTAWSAILTLAEGANTIYVRVTDSSGNTATSKLQVTVAPQGIPFWVWALAAVGIAGAAAAAYMMMRRRRRPAADTRSPPR